MSIREYIRKKTGKPAYTACVRKNGLISTRTFTDRGKAKEWEVAERKRLLRESLLANPSNGEGGHYKLKKVIEDFKLEGLSSVSKSWASYLKWIEHFLGEIRLKDLTANMIEEARSAYMRHPEQDGRPRLKPASGNKFTTGVAMIINYSIKKRWLSDSPMKGWENLPETPYQRTRWLRDEERVRLLEAASKSKSLPLRTVILVSLYTGYRKEVIQTLTWGSIDFELNVINVPQKYNREGKQGKPRAFNLPMVPELRELLLKHRQLMMSAGVQSPYLFPSPTDAQKPWDFSHPFRTAVKNAGLKDFHAHDLRHTAATYLARSGISTQVIQRFLGHMDSRITERYIQRPDEYMQKEMTRALVNLDGVSRDKTTPDSEEEN